MLPTADDNTLADLVLNHLKSSDSATATAMADVALKWNDLKRWKAVIKNSGQTSSVFGVEKLLQAWKTFSFEHVYVR
jgi:hypothetical protein